eukprot:gnl/MRDRNA2_/MRDRNA2_28106_c0_seq1.p1 gnl/MRDRNA2_/MRDRNA2_28106_c0~~gnl/MRDRNA2_/MRDRNA2_28106_c0_seq1.p1  ORF type:complete len:691 (-),score=103.14 gnl/MRDRNA2_/MRDRNA2_28106_c0_seq1:38-2110(-)
MAILKGAPDRLMPYASSLMNFDTGILCCPGAPISAEDLVWLESKNRELADRALRSVMVTVLPMSAQDITALQSAPGADERLQLLLDRGLCFLNIWGIYDPPRATVPASIRECHEAGVRVVMITGDQQPTAFAIGRQCGIIAEDAPSTTARLCADMQTNPATAPPVSASRNLSQRASVLLQEGRLSLQRQPTVAKRPSQESVLQPIAETTSLKNPETQEGPQYLPLNEIDAMTEQVNVWARAQPTDKVTVVESLQRQGHVAAMTGDGVNDAPALRKASVGVSMGIAGTAVAQNASDLILLDDEFTSIVAAIREGRRIYENLSKYLTSSVGAKGAECVLLLGAIIAGMPVPIRPTHQLLNLVNTHIVTTMPYTFEEADPWIMKIPPRKLEGDVIVSKTQWWYRWAPMILTLFTLVNCVHVIGIRAHTGFLYNHELIANSVVGMLDKGEVACESAGQLRDGAFVESASPFHCRCSVSQGWLWAGEKVEVEQWGRVTDETEVDKVFDPWTGSFGDFYNKNATPWKDGTDSLLEKCKDANGVERWCWKDKGPDETRPLLSKGRDCASYGIAIGQSMTFSTINLGELVMIISQRTNSGFFTRLSQNGWMIVASIYNIAFWASYYYLPPFTNILGLAPLSCHHLVVVFGFVLCAAVSSEVIKVFYVSKVQADNAILEKEALRLSCGTNPKGELACDV